MHPSMHFMSAASVNLLCMAEGYTWSVHAVLPDAAQSLENWSIYNSFFPLVQTDEPVNRATNLADNQIAHNAPVKYRTRRASAFSRVNSGWLPIRGVIPVIPFLVEPR
jgi:hypothetical protein